MYNDNDSRNEYHKIGTIMTDTIHSYVVVFLKTIHTVCICSVVYIVNNSCAEQSTHEDFVSYTRMSMELGTTLQI